MRGLVFAKDWGVANGVVVCVGAERCGLACEMSGMWLRAMV